LDVAVVQGDIPYSMDEPKRQRQELALHPDQLEARLYQAALMALLRVLKRRKKSRLNNIDQ
jgi:hypothetical protein